MALKYVDVYFPFMWTVAAITPVWFVGTLIYVRRHPPKRRDEERAQPKKTSASA